MYCRQTGALSAGVTEGPLSKTQRKWKFDSVCVCNSRALVGQPAGGGQVRSLYVLPVLDTDTHPQNRFTSAQKNHKTHTHFLLQDGL